MRLLLIILILPFFASAQNFRPDSAKRKELEQRKEIKRYKNFKFPPLQQEIIDKCNTAASESYLTFEEKEFILLHNLARTNPEFFKTYVTLQYDSSYTSKIPNIKNIDRNLLQPDKGLFQSAKMHAIKSGKNGTIGHQNLDKRILKYNYHFVKKDKRYYGENCSYGDKTAIEYFIGLLNSAGHFKNIMIPEYNRIGVSEQSHIKYVTNMVSCFAKK